jgi:sulfur carrier protein
MRLVINGTPHELPTEATVEHAVDATGAESSRGGLAVAVDGEVVPRGEWGRTPLQDGQRVEILQAVQGGA